jgi:hydroxymethylpyrimidine pyrophosphatase-like HAD family hydrolase
MDKYTQRLVEEWKEHGRLILAVDYDDTIFPYKTATGEECLELIEYLRLIQDKLWIIIWTASKPERYEEIRSYCSSVGLEIVGVNTAAIPNLKFGTESKPYFNLLIDDRAGKELAIQQLKKAYKEVYGN